MGTVKTFIGNIKGKPGNTPYVGDNGNWWIGELDTGVKAEGEDGKSAYQYAVEGGYTGTEEEFSKKLNETAMDAYTKKEADNKFLSSEGGTITGDLTAVGAVAASSFALSGEDEPYATLKFENPYVVMEAASGRTMIVRPYANNAYGVAFSTSYVYPETTDRLSLGKTSRMFKHLYLTGNITDGTNSVSVANIAKKSALESVSSTATSAQELAEGALAAAGSALEESKRYTDEEISTLINGAPTTLDTLGEIATAMAENADVVTALNNAIGSKASAADLTAHINNKSNPHGVTAEQAGAVPTSRTVNGKALSENISLSAADIGLTTETWTFTLEDGSTVTKAVHVG